MVLRLYLLNVNVLMFKHRQIRNVKRREEENVHSASLYISHLKGIMSSIQRNAHFDCLLMLECVDHQNTATAFGGEATPPGTFNGTLLRKNEYLRSL